jgi:hypothetical protein
MFWTLETGFTVFRFLGLRGMNVTCSETFISRRWQLRRGLYGVNRRMMNWKGRRRTQEVINWHLPGDDEIPGAGYPAFQPMLDLVISRIRVRSFTARPNFLDYFFFKIGIEGGVQLGLPVGLLCQPRVIMMMEKLVEWLVGEIEVLGKTCPSATLSTTNPTCCPDANPGRRDGKPATNRFSYGTASSIT